ncbi:hypothetical protein E3P81_00049 [Wallemia ichthyophaga]|uniref:Cytochrome b5 heme-binding domain-containing protein n=1 Tax=Wallemia ichthyophaga TaxID=245174 RepID=A0A4T0G103_WALIC|nr:hypothetical protein E3P97_00122 [Wallemia ichthyophaga]TIA97364.1 hypothetical protein E3P96_03406 [Wallemia ichthyophaga]TIB32520.1 hypothetical protein E3P86_03125 [Wallemia ichthyophaga]TIB36162.1 hypothetical protein E3P85_00049 [Wallemia ichthyophaga]TIB51536.1 hypothetical protein E3P82_00122 [Wallemia ichthyophaga]
MTSPSLHAVMESQKKHADEFWKLFHKAKIHSDAPSEDGENDVVSVYTGSGISTPNRRRDRSEERIGPERDPMKIFTHDISTNIFRRLSQQDLKQCHRVCKRWRRSQVINYIWFEIYRQRFFDGESTQSLQGKWTRRESRQDWKLMYKSANRRPFESAVVEQLERSITPSQIREAQWDAEANKPPPTKNEQREEYKLLKGRKPRSKGVRGENTSKGVRDESGSIMLFKLFKFILLSLLVYATLAFFIFDDLLLGYQGKWRHIKSYLPRPPQRSFSVDQLADFNGRNGKDIYLAVNGLVFDVSSNPRIYGPGGMYHAAVAKDAARAFVTNCFKDQPTHDLRGLTEKELSQVKGWQSFFDNHPKYMLIGTVDTPAIDPDAPIPEDCGFKQSTKDDGKVKSEL